MYFPITASVSNWTGYTELSRYYSIEEVSISFKSSDKLKNYKLFYVESKYGNGGW